MRINLGEIAFWAIILGGICLGPFLAYYALMLAVFAGLWAAGILT